MLDYLDGNELYQEIKEAIEDEIYYQLEVMVLNDFKIDDLVKIANYSFEDAGTEIIKKDDDLYVLVNDMYPNEETEISADELREHIKDLVGNNWDLGLREMVLDNHENGFDIYEIGKIIEEIKEIQDVFGV